MASHKDGMAMINKTDILGSEATIYQKFSRNTVISLLGKQKKWGSTKSCFQLFLNIIIRQQIFLI